MEDVAPAQRVEELADRGLDRGAREADGLDLLVDERDLARRRTELRPPPKPARGYERLGSLRDDEAVRPWIAQLTRRLCIDRLRAAVRDPVPDDSEERGELDRRMIAVDEAVSVQEAMRTLSADCREILDRFFCRDQSYNTIGELLDLPPGTIASRISRCLGKLRTAYEGRSGPAPASGEA